MTRIALRLLCLLYCITCLPANGQVSKTTANNEQLVMEDFNLTHGAVAGMKDD